MIGGTSNGAFQFLIAAKGPQDECSRTLISAGKYSCLDLERHFQIDTLDSPLV